MVIITDVAQMPEHNGRLLILSDDEALADRVAAAVSRFGWNCEVSSALPGLLGRLQGTAPAAVLVDAAAPHADEAGSAIRSLPAPFNGTPILTLGGEAAVAAGAGGHLGGPFDDAALLDLLRRWAGPLDAGALRAVPWTARYRLIRLLGLDAADAMLLRLRDTLAEAIAAPAGEPVSAHRLAGVAGLCGFAELGQTWSRAERREDGALAAAIEASRATIGEIERALG